MSRSPSSASAAVKNKKPMGFAMLASLLLAGCAAPVELRVGPERLDLGSVEAGGGATGVIELQLLSPGPAALSLSIDPPDAPFRVLGAPQGGIAQGDHYFVLVEYRPDEPGLDVAALAVEVDAGDARRRLDLELRGVSTAAQPDRDRDGWPLGEDCDDADPAVHPGVQETCDGRDQNCDGLLGVGEEDVDGDGVPLCAGDCDDHRATAYPGAEEVCDGVDSNCDGVMPAEELDLDHDTYPPCAGDCADLDPTRHPDQPEFCDGLDTDCDGVLFESELDQDGDGALPCAGDCDDSDPLRGPGFPEFCDRLDDDCDGALPADEADLDGDGVAACEGDCDDANGAIHPGEVEACDGVDDDCDGVVPPDEVDGDGDGFLACADCDDGDPSVFPGAPELCDGIDGDCSGAPAPDEVDADGDGFRACIDCDDGAPGTYPGAPELCDTIDENCDGLPGPGEHDGDGDGSLACADCDDADPDSYPGAPELCDRLDNDCSGGLPADELDGDADGVTPCEGDCDDADPGRSPMEADACYDSIDQDCDGVVNGGCTCPRWVAPSAPAACAESGTFGCPDTSVQAAVDALELDACGEIWIQPGTYSGPVQVHAATALLGLGDREDVILYGALLGPVLTSDGPSLALEALTLSGGVGAVDSASGTLTLSDVLIRDNACGVGGDTGGVRAAGTTVEARGSWFLDNLCGEAGSAGGGLLVVTGDALVDGCRFARNTAESGAALVVQAGQGTVTHSVFTGNVATDQGSGFGGAVSLGDGAFVANDLFASNASDVGAGALRLVDPGPTTVVANNVFVENQGGLGGGVQLDLSGPAGGTIENNVVVGNAPFGLFASGGAFPNQCLYNDVWANDADWGSPLGPGAPAGNLSFDPQFAQLSMDGDPGNDDFTLGPASASRDAGDPGPSWFDPDGSINDLGLFGGPLGDWAGP